MRCGWLEIAAEHTPCLLLLWGPQRRCSAPQDKSPLQPGGWAGSPSSARRKTSAGKARRRSTSPPAVSWSCSLWPARPTPAPWDTRPRGRAPGGFPCPPVILACHHPALPHVLLEDPPGLQAAAPNRVPCPPRGSAHGGGGVPDSRGGWSPANGPGPHTRALCGPQSSLGACSGLSAPHPGG